MGKDIKEYHKIDDIITYYRDTQTVSKYEKTRFTSPIRQIIHNSELNIIKKHIPGKDCLVLDVPIGTGRIARGIGISGIGVDSSEEMIKSTIKNLTDWELIHGNAYSLPFKNDQFDCVYSFAFIGHFNEENRQKLYFDIYRVLKNRGIFIFDVVYKESKLVKYLHDKFRKQFGSNWVFYTSFNESEIEGEIQSIGFKIIKIYTHKRMFLFKALEELSNYFIQQRSFNEILKRYIYKIEKELYNGAKRPYKLVIVCQK